MLGPTDVVSILGRRGCGKSTLTRKLSALYRRRVVLDRLREWSAEPGAQVAEGFAGFAAAWPHVHDRPRFTLVCQYELGVQPDALAADCNSVIRALYLTGRDGDGVCLVLEEAQHYATPHRMEPWVAESVFTGRHSGLAIIANSQRPASVHKGLISQSHHLFVGALTERNDLAYLHSMYGDPVLAAQTLPPFEFLHFAHGQPPVRVRL